MVIDWNVRFGDILVMVSFGVGAIIFAYRAGVFARSIDEVKTDMTELRTGYKEVADLLVSVAVQATKIDAQNDRLNILDRRIEDLRRGEGLIVTRRHDPAE